MDFVFKTNLCIKSLCIIHVILASNLHEMAKANLITTNMGHAREDTLNVNRSSVHLSNHLPAAIKCNVHSNCTQRIFALDSYCCQTSELCCSWFEYVLKYDPKMVGAHTLPYKGPTLLTIFVLLIATIVTLFVFYCFLITVCYCCKCGLFKKPNIVVINEMSAHSHGSDVTSAEIITPKSSSSASSSLSSSDISYTSSNNHHHHHHHRHHNQIYNEQRRPNKKSYSGSNFAHGKRYTNVKKSPKARAYVSNSTSVLANTSHNLTSRHSNAAASARLFADPNCYVDYDNDSPFLAPAESNKYSRRSNQPTRHGSQRREAAANNSTANNSRRNGRQLSMTNQRNENLIVSTRNGTVLDPFDDELATVNSQIININEAASSHTSSGSESGAEEAATSPSRSSSSIDFELPNALSSALSVNNPTVNQHHNHHQHQAATAIDSSKVPSYYLDEKPPSYDDIINNRK